LARLHPLRGVRYNPEHVRLGGVLAPPYDVISPARREELYGCDLRNIVRIDFGQPYPDDVAGRSDVYTRAAAHLRSWIDLGILVQDTQPGLYLVAHEFETPNGTQQRRLGLIGRVPALPWERSEVRPHELTLRVPKEDRLALMRTTQAQTSPVWLLWDGAPGLGRRLSEIAEAPALLGGRFDGEMGPEKVLVWQVSDRAVLAEIGALLDPSTLYIADGHHRFETMAAYAAERRAAGDGADADSQFALVYASAAEDTALVVLPIHRLVRPRPGLPISQGELLARLGGTWELEPVADPVASLARLGERGATEHAYVLVAPDGTAVLRRPRCDPGSRRDALDVSVLQSEVISGCGIGEAELRESALEYTRDPADAVAAVRDGRAGLAFLVSACTSREVMAVADARENMPQKSTYFYPKVPTGLIISAL
jgi:uncharacterized protein (DUF1015 family)